MEQEEHVSDVTSTEDVPVELKANQKMVGVDLQSTGENGIVHLDVEAKDIEKAHPTFWTNLISYANDYTDKSSLHAVKYFGERRNIFEKLWWLVIFIIFIHFCTSSISETYQKWVRTPVMITSAPNPILVWELPFPAVTVCPINKIRQSVFNYTDVYYRLKSGDSQLTADEVRKFNDLSFMCLNQELSNTTDQFLNTSVIDLLQEVSPKMEDLFGECTFGSYKNLSRKDIFTKILTKDGVCYTSNMLNWEHIFFNDTFRIKNDLTATKLTDWSLDNGYLEDQFLGETYPRRSIVADSSSGLSFVLQTDVKDLDYICRGPWQGYNIILHHPTEIPRVQSQFVHAPLNSELIIRIKPDLTFTSDVLKSYEPHMRRCYFQQEKKLKFYKDYSLENCRDECLTNYTFVVCDCVPFYSPHAINTPMCGMSQMECITRAKTKFFDMLVKGILPSCDHINWMTSVGCDCLPACTSLVYRSEVSQDSYNWKVPTRANKNDTSNSGVYSTRITIYYDESEFKMSIRQELYYDITGFLANCGGLLGIFFGFSFLSVVEIFYFLTWRLCSNLKMYGRRYWSGKIGIKNE